MVDHIIARLYDLNLCLHCRIQYFTGQVTPSSLQNLTGKAPNLGRPNVSQVHFNFRSHVRAVASPVAWLYGGKQPLKTVRWTHWSPSKSLLNGAIESHMCWRHAGATPRAHSFRVNAH